MFRGTAVVNGDNNGGGAVTEKTATEGVVYGGVDGGMSEAATVKEDDDGEVDDVIGGTVDADEEVGGTVNETVVRDDAVNRDGVSGDLTVEVLVEVTVERAVRSPLHVVS